MIVKYNTTIFNQILKLLFSVFFIFIFIFSIHISEYVKPSQTINRLNMEKDPYKRFKLHEKK